MARGMHISVYEHDDLCRVRACTVEAAHSITVKGMAYRNTDVMSDFKYLECKKVSSHFPDTVIILRSFYDA